jgi:hypothetical protein
MKDSFFLKTNQRTVSLAMLLALLKHHVGQWHGPMTDGCACELVLWQTKILERIAQSLWRKYAPKAHANEE